MATSPELINIHSLSFSGTIDLGDGEERFAGQIFDDLVCLFQ